LAILKLLENSILEARGEDEILEILKSPTSHFMISRESFMKIALSFQISKQMMHDLEFFAKKQYSPPHIFFDYQKKRFYCKTQLNIRNNERTTFIDNKKSFELNSFDSHNKESLSFYGRENICEDLNELRMSINPVRAGTKNFASKLLPK